MSIFSIIVSHNARSGHVDAGKSDQDSLYQFYFINLIVNYIVGFLALFGIFGYAKMISAGMG